MLGSAFNPPHLGHLVLAEAAAAQLGLEEVVLVPTGESPHKRIEGDPGRDVRLEMTRLAAAGADLLSVSEIETSRDGPSYAYRTLELLGEERRGTGLVWLMGADSAMELESWRRPERIVELAGLAIARRVAVEWDAVEAVLGRLGVGVFGAGSGEGEGRWAERIEMPLIGISSSDLRARVREGRPIRYLVPDPVWELIAAERLYSG